VHNLLFSLQLRSFSDKTDFCALRFSVDGVLEADIKIQLNFPTILSFKSKPVYNVTLALFVDVFSSNDFLEPVYSDWASQEKTVDLRVKWAPRSPRFNFNLVVSCFFRHSYEWVTFNSMAAPAVDWVHL